MSSWATAATKPLRPGKILSWPHLKLVPQQAGHGPGDIHNVLIVGAGKSGRAIATQLREDLHAQRNLQGFVDDHLPLGGDVCGRIADLSRLIQANFVDEIILTPPHNPEVVRRVVRTAYQNHSNITVVPDLFEFAPESVSFGRLGNIPVLKMHKQHCPQLSLFLKRIVDVALSAIALVLAAPLLAAIAMVIRLDTPGPVIYRGFRVGKKGEKFVCYKFRTMIAEADQLQEQLRARNQRRGPFFKIAADPRITRIGGFLRRYSLDELPQLWNVLKGKMSLVGPRPHPVDDFERYDAEHLRRLRVTPGMTGLWQITARSDPSFERNMQLDVEYIERWSLWLDFRILLNTLPAVLQGNGA